MQETAEKVGQNAGENIGLGAPGTRDLTRDTLGDFAGGFMVGGPIGALGGHASRGGTPAAGENNGQQAPPQTAPFVATPETLDTSVLAAAVAPDAERADMIDRLTELDTKAADKPKKTDASGKVTHKD